MRASWLFLVSLCVAGPDCAPLPQALPALPRQKPDLHSCPCAHPPIKQGGCEDEHQRMDYMARDKFFAAHNEDQ